MFEVKKKDLKVKNIMLPVSEDEHEFVKKMAKDRGLKVTEMLRLLLSKESNSPSMQLVGKKIILQDEMFTDESYKKMLSGKRK